MTTTIFLESNEGYVAEVDRDTIMELSKLIKDLLQEDEEDSSEDGDVGGIDMEMDTGVASVPVPKPHTQVTLPLLNINTFALEAIEGFCVLYKENPLKEGGIAEPVKANKPFRESVTPDVYVDLLPSVDLTDPDEHTMDQINVLMDAAKYLMMDAFVYLLNANIGYAINTIGAKYPGKDQLSEAVEVFRKVFHIENDFEEGEEERVHKELNEIM